MAESVDGYDAIVIGSGFAGAVTACRLAEAKQRVLVLERGRRYQADDLPVYPKTEVGEGATGGLPDFSRSFWRLGQGLWDLRDLGDLVVAQAAGYGGGSLIYANVHLRAPAEVFDERWPERFSGGQLLEAYYDLAAYMLEVEMPPEELGLRKSRQLERAAATLGLVAFPVPLAVSFGRRRENRFGVKQAACDLRGECCFGCGARGPDGESQAGAKNTLDLNYLLLAEQHGAVVQALAEVLLIQKQRRRDGEAGRYSVEYRSHVDRELKSATAPRVFLCAGALNTTELLLRSRAAGTLPGDWPKPGGFFFPNADTLAVAFDCDALHDADRGPTITRAIVHDRAPDADDPLARWTVAFSDGKGFDGREPVPGREVRSDRGSGTLAYRPILRSGSWTEGNAVGELVLSGLGGTLEPGGLVREDGVWSARITTEPRRPSHWFMIQDGGMPEPLEPLLGVFRSPLWLRRNRFREPSAEGPETASSPKPGYAELPFRSLSDVAASLPRGALDGVPALRSDMLWGWNLLPPQLREALARDRRELLDAFGTGAEGMVGEFLDRAAARIEAQYGFEETLKGLPLFGLDVRGVGNVQLGRMVLRLAVQLAFGSQALLARDTASWLLDETTERFGGRLFDLLRWALDYRLSEGRNGVLLAMGRDSLPGELSLADGPEFGNTIAGEKSGAEAILIGASVQGSWLLGAAAGTLVLAKRRGTFHKEEPLLWAGTILGVASSEEQPLDLPRPDLAEPALRVAVGHLRLCVLQVRPAAPGSSASRVELLARIPLRVRLPDAFDTPERATQERLLREIAREWGGELRTNPSGSLLGRQVTVHAQGGCPMGVVTDEVGEVAGCEGLYVMDAAAFPTSVGVNPSATITAIAEYKVEQVIRSIRDDDTWRAEHFEQARAWANAPENRLLLEPPRMRLAPHGPRVPPPPLGPIGIEFAEVMRGELEDARSTPIVSSLRAKIPDLARFLEYHRREQAQRIRVEGTVQVGRDALDVVGESYIRLFSSTSKVHGSEYRRMEYELELRDGHAVSGHLSGRKNLQDEAGRFDLWEDATTLRFKLTRNRVETKGTLRLPPEDFFEGQLPSFRATGTTDRARQSWALAAFGRFFLGHLVDIYVPELDRVVDVVKRLVEHSDA